MKFLIVIGKSALYTYKRNGQEFETQFIEGSECYSYNLSNISEDINGYLDALANEKNLETKAKLEFDVLECADRFCNKGVLNILEEYVDNKYEFDSVMEAVIKKLSRDKSLLVTEYGVNYDGYSYVMADGILRQKEFDLLSYTIHSRDVIDLMDIN